MAEDRPQYVSGLWRVSARRQETANRKSAAPSQKASCERFHDLQSDAAFMSQSKDLLSGNSQVLRLSRRRRVHGQQVKAQRIVRQHERIKDVSE